MKDANGNWAGWGLGDIDPTVQKMKEFLKAKFSYASVLDDSETYDQTMVDVVDEMQTRYGLPATGVMNYATEVRCGFYVPLPPPMHAIITFNGTWGAGLVQYPGNVINGLHAYVDPNLCYEVVCPYPASFGPVPPGDVSSPSYDQSVQWAITWTANWLEQHPNQTFGMIGYSQGAEAAARVLMELQEGSLTEYMPNFIGGITFGNPCRGAGFHAADIADPGGHGIATKRMTSLPRIGNTVVWADYCHSKANRDAADDMYAIVPADASGDVMVDFYDIATELQLNDGITFITNMVSSISKAANDITVNIVGGLEAAAKGIAFIAAPGGPTAPHISYLGEIPGYSNLVQNAVGFLQKICQLTPVRT